MCVSVKHHAILIESCVFRKLLHELNPEMFQIPLIKVGFGCFNNNSFIKSFEMGKSK